MTDIINSIPVETLVEILLRTDGRSLARCRQVCKKWQDIIDESDLLWEKICIQEFKIASKIAKKRAALDTTWYHIYRNLYTWADVASYEMNIREFYKFCLNDKQHALAIDYGVLPLKDTRGIVLYDMSHLKYIPVAVPERHCFKIANNDFASVILVKSGILVQKNIENSSTMSEAYFDADDFVLHKKELYFFDNRSIYLCDLNVDTLSSRLILNCEYDIKEIQYYEGTIHIFTDCGNIVSITKDLNVTVKPLNCPQDWIKQIKHIQAVNDKNFVCYSRNLFKIVTDKYQHLYLDFPIITALFFYGDFVLIATKNGEILLYRLSSQKRATKPVFEKLVEMPDGKFAIQLDVSERRSGPIIVASTFYETMLLEIDFFPQDKKSKTAFEDRKIKMYKRLLRLKDRLRVGVPSLLSMS